MGTSDQAVPATMTVNEAAALYGLSRGAAYRACRSYLATDGAEGIPCIRIGKRIVVPSAAVRRQLGLDEAA